MATNNADPRFSHGRNDAPDLARHMRAVAAELLGEPNKHLSNGHELRFGTHGSLSVDLADGTWFDHEHGAGGGVLDLVARERRVDRRGALAWLRERGFVNGEARPSRRVTDRYVYADAQGRPRHRTLRWEPKGFSQQRYENGKWVGGKGALNGVERLLYHEADLAGADEVWIAEGEKDADRLRTLGFVATTCAEGTGKWQPRFSGVLAGKRVVVLPDNDTAGRKHAAEVAAGLIGKATSVKVLALEGLPPKGDVSDWLDQDHTAEELRELAAKAPEWTPPEPGKKAGADRDEAAAWDEVNRTAAAGTRQGEFLLARVPAAGHEPGVYRLQRVKDPETGFPVPTWVRVCSPLEVLAYSRDAASERWGRLLLVTDRDGVVHEWPMPTAMLAGDGVDFRKALFGLGLTLAPGRAARDALGDYVAAWEPTVRVRSVDRTGWNGGAFVLPDAVFGAVGDGRERVVLQVGGKPPRYAVAGSLEGWSEEVARLAVGNSRLVFGLSAAFAGPLLDPLGEEGGGFHFCGPSSIGKTTALLCAASAWGLAPCSWRTTDNAAEATAHSANDTLLCMDDSSQADPRSVGEIVFMLTNGAGKSRLNRDGTARDVSAWRLQYLSSGEAGLAAKLQEVGRKARAGQEVRLAEIPADAGRGSGLFEDLHGFADGAALARHLKEACARHKGHAARAFLAAIVGDLPGVAAKTAAYRDRWLEAHLPQGSLDGQVRRVARRFAVVAAAGELARAVLELPWTKGEAGRAAATCFGAWLATRGGAGPAETREGLAQVRAFLEQHGSSRFEAAWAREDTPAEGKAPTEEPDAFARTINRAGFRRLVGDGLWVFYLLRETWKSEVCKGLDATAVARAMADAGYLERGDGNNLTQTVRVPGYGKLRVYVIAPGFLGDGA